MQIIPAVLFTAISLLLAGCSYGYRATGSLDGRADTFTGKADLRNSGGGKFSLSSASEDLICDGQADPPEPSPTGCLGETGSGQLRCSDGRIFNLSWRATTCRAFEGTGIDQNGKAMRFSVRRDHN